MENSPLISILCLCYNQSKFIIESLESIKNQTYKNFEILICDDSSRDNSVEVVEGWIKENSQTSVTFIKHSENKGICKSLNELLKLSKGKYIQILALDDILLPEKFKRHVSILENSTNKDAMVFSDSYLINDDSEKYQNRFIAMHIWYLSLKSQNFFDMLVRDNFIPAMSVMIKRNIIIEENGWDENLSYEDYDMWLRLSKKYDFLFDETISCCYRLHDNNSHKKKDFLNDSYFKILIKHKENSVIKIKLFKLVEKLYLEKKLKDEHRIYFKEFPATTFPQKCIAHKRNPQLYELALIVKKMIQK